MLQKPYGYELVLDLHDCDSTMFNRENIEAYFIELCEAIDMTRCDLHFWDDVGLLKEECQTSPHTKGTSAVQFILTSSIVIHCLDLLEVVFINIFSCKEFDQEKAEEVSCRFFNGKSHKPRFLERVMA